MITGNIGQLDKSRDEFPEVIRQALIVIKGMDFSVHLDGQAEFNGLLFKTFTANTDLPENRTPETHKDFIDIQFVISGDELVEFSSLGDSQPNVHKPEEDNYFYLRPSLTLNEMRLRNGDFVVFFPWDIHSPLCHKNEQNIVRKIVVKVPIASL
jgi:biofilm protein TabA